MPKRYRKSQEVYIQQDTGGPHYQQGHRCVRVGPVEGLESFGRHSRIPTLQIRQRQADFIEEPDNETSGKEYTGR